MRYHSNVLINGAKEKYRNLVVDVPSCCTEFCQVPFIDPAIYPHGKCHKSTYPDAITEIVGV